jgi:hypothetical protein
MSGNNSMTLLNSTNINFNTFVSVATNSGQELGVAAGNKLLQRQESQSAPFTIDKTLLRIFMVFFSDESGTFWQSQGVEFSALDPSDTWTVTVTISGNAPNMSMTMDATSSSGKARSAGPFSIFKVASGTAAQAA